jgi:cupin 2 domain-containing protein
MHFWSLLNHSKEAIQRSLEQNEEILEVLTQGNFIKIERIISTGQTTSPDQIYDQEWDEFVLLLQGTAKITMVETGRVIDMNKGDSVLIKAHEKHVVSFTSKEPPCIWLAVHFDSSRN